MKDYLQPREWKLRTSPLDSGGAGDASPGTFASSDDAEALIAAVSEKTGLSTITLRVCFLRGLDSAEAIDKHLNPKLESLTSPLSIKGMESAVGRLARAREEQQLVRVFGDYDVDGTTGTALLSWFFRDAGFRYEARQPHRFKDGYGLNVGAVEEAAAAGVKVLVTVDCGITSFDAAQRAKELGVDLIVVDHHQLDPNRGLPEAVAVVNPQRPDCESGLRQLCGCGLAFYLAMALRAHGRGAGWFAIGAEPNLRQHLDLVVMATAADMVPLTGDNHVLVRHGLEVLKTSRKPGVRALLEAAGLGTKDVSPGHLGFVIGPRINASGRMQSASLALELLTTTDSVRAGELARELERLNSERAEVQNQIWDQVRVKVEEGIAQGRFKHGIVVADPAWHEGVVGIVASRVTETFRRPAAVIAIREDGVGKGSVRSWGGKDILSAIRAGGMHLLGFGGHKHAAGLSLSPVNLDAFTEAFDHALSLIEEDAISKPLLIEGACKIEEFTVQTLQELERLGPFGPGNPEPVFMVQATVQSHRILKGRHLKLYLQSEKAAELSPRPGTLEAIWFHAAEREDLLQGIGGAASTFWAGVPELNRFRGQLTPSFRVRDWRREAP